MKRRVESDLIKQAVRKMYPESDEIKGIEIHINNKGEIEASLFYRDNFDEVWRPTKHIIGQTF